MSDDRRPLDSEINFRVVISLTVALLVVVTVTGVLMWLLSDYLRDRQEATDPPPPMLMEARMPYEPPAPRLQTDPVTDLRELRAAEDLGLASYAWVDRASGVARIPVARAMDLLVEHGLPESGSDGGPTAAPGPAAPGSARP